MWRPATTVKNGALFRKAKRVGTLNQSKMNNQLPVGGIRLLDKAAAAQTDFGPLTQLQGTWKGAPKQGWNVIAVPGPVDFTLEVIPYEETLTFSPAVIAGNRGPFSGGQEEVQSVTGFLYEQVITSACDTDLCKKMGFPSGTQIHAETGLFLYLANDAAGFSIARLSTIPHGNSLLALGNGTDTSSPSNFIPNNTVTPFPIPAGYDETQYPDQQFPGVFDQENPNSFLQGVIANQKIASVTTLDFSTKNATGGVLNIPFLKTNVAATQVDATFWIETLGDGSLQLQYSQSILLAFPPTGSTAIINWPHVTVNTLQKMSD